LKADEPAKRKKYDKICMMMDGNNAQNTSSKIPENLSFLEKTEERYARLKVIPGRMNRKRKRVDTANATMVLV
jgi:CRISPR/Cas system-associated protein endoribonuclease Cas2